jgi:hypothetical protein
VLHPTIEPERVCSYIDVLRIWLRNPLSSAQLSWLRQRSAGKKLRVHNGRAPFGRGYVQRITIFQPSQEALQSLATCSDHLLTYVECSLDWVFNSRIETDDAFEYVCKRVIKRHHRDQGIRFVGTGDEKTRYSGPRRAPNLLVIYGDRPSKKGGHHCVHFDWRMNGSGTLRRTGIHSLHDLLALDHRDFWRARLIICDLDLRRLGRMYWNHRLHGKRRHWMQFCPNGKLVYDKHLRTGSIIARARASTQAVVDQYRVLRA